MKSFSIASVVIASALALTAVGCSHSTEDDVASGDDQNVTESSFEKLLYSLPPGEQPANPPADRTHKDECVYAREELNPIANAIESASGALIGSDPDSNRCNVVFWFRDD